jgi:predicted alternative tryptophan synthase beta-subunit
MFQPLKGSYVFISLIVSKSERERLIKVRPNTFYIDESDLPRQWYNILQIAVAPAAFPTPKLCNLTRNSIVFFPWIDPKRSARALSRHPEEVRRSTVVSPHPLIVAPSWKNHVRQPIFVKYEGASPSAATNPIPPFRRLFIINEPG